MPAAPIWLPERGRREGGSGAGATLAVIRGPGANIGAYHTRTRTFSVLGPSALHFAPVAVQWTYEPGRLGHGDGT
jgi:hypothetical protein